MYQVKTPFCTNMPFFFLSADTPVYDFLESCLRHKSEVKVILVVYGKKQSYFSFFFFFNYRDLIFLEIIHMQVLYYTSRSFPAR